MYLTYLTTLHYLPFSTYPLLLTLFNGPHTILNNRAQANGTFKLVRREYYEKCFIFIIHVIIEHMITTIKKTIFFTNVDSRNIAEFFSSPIKKDLNKLPCI